MDGVDLERVVPHGLHLLLRVFKIMAYPNVFVKCKISAYVDKFFFSLSWRMLRQAHLCMSNLCLKIFSFVTIGRRLRCPELVTYNVQTQILNLVARDS